MKQSVKPVSKKMKHTCGLTKLVMEENKLLSHYKVPAINSPHDVHTVSTAGLILFSIFTF